MLFIVCWLNIVSLVVGLVMYSCIQHKFQDYFFNYIRKMAAIYINAFLQALLEAISVGPHQ